MVYYINIGKIKKMAEKFKQLLTDLIGTKVQELEEVFRKLLLRLDVDNAVGTQLDGIGSIVGQAREGNDDDKYKILIKLKIGINVSEGTIEDIITIWKLVTNGTNVTVEEVFPAKVKLTTDEYVTEDLTWIKEKMEQILAGGVGIKSIIVDDPTRFGFGSSRGHFGSHWPSSA